MVLLILFTSCTTQPVTNIETKSSSVPTKTPVINESDENYKILMETGMFAIDAIGENGAIPKELKAFGKLYTKDNAKEYFIDLEKNATLEGKLYALCGLYYLDNSYFYEVIEKYKTMKSKVFCMFGCLMHEFKVYGLIENDKDNNVVRLFDTNDTIEAWRKRNNIDSVMYDFIGGGYPYTVRMNSVM